MSGSPRRSSSGPEHPGARERPGSHQLDAAGRMVGIVAIADAEPVRGPQDRHRRARLRSRPTTRKASCCIATFGSNRWTEAGFGLTADSRSKLRPGFAYPVSLAVRPESPSVRVAPPRGARRPAHLWRGSRSTNPDGASLLPGGPRCRSLDSTSLPSADGSWRSF